MGFGIGRLLKRIAAPLAAAAVMAATGLCAGALSGADLKADYKLIVFNWDMGLDTYEMNAVAQTADGYIWMGTYSGLIRYDGRTFEYFNFGGEISTVRSLFVDSKDYLWIGTNDSGIYRYDIYTRELVRFTTADGLGSNTIRAICEDDRGRLYIGTAGALTLYEEESGMSVIDIDGLVNVESLDFADGRICAVSASGEVFFAENGRFSDTTLVYPESGVYYTCSAWVNGSLMIGSSAGSVTKYSEDGGTEVICEYEGLGSITCILPYGEDGGCFVCGYGNFGFLAADGVFTSIGNDSFRGSVSDVMTDNQNNVWFVSDKLGVCKLSPNPFENCFSAAGISDNVVNCVLKLGGDIYVGCDNGLVVFDAETKQAKTNSLTEMLNGIRIRHIMEDSKEQLWVSTYGGEGLLCVQPDGSTEWLSETNSIAKGTRFRSTLELSDGTIAAASTMGISFIRDGEVIASLGSEDGLSVPQILTMSERADGTLLCGSDGDGIYIIKNYKLEGKIDELRGLDTPVVLRIVPCKGGHIYVTSNALYFDNGNEVARLTNFPYSNNYDVFNVGGGCLWISSSRGIYIVNEDDLVANGDYEWKLLNRAQGFDTTLTSNAWNYLDADGSYYLCCSDGVRRVSVNEYNEINGEYEVAVNGVTADDETIPPDLELSAFVIPAGASRIVIRPAVLNYSLSNPEVRMFMEGFDTNYVSVLQSDLMPMTYTNLPGGSYKFHVQVLDENTGDVVKETVVDIIKKKAFYENSWFVLLCVAAGCLVVVAITLLIAKLNSVRALQRQIEETQKARDEAEQATKARGRFLANMSHEIRTPINTIMGMNEMILRESDSPSISEYAGNIKNSGKTLLDLVDNVLNYSKIESGKMEIINSEYDLGEMLNYLVNVLRSRSEGKNLEIKLDISPDLPKRMLGDEVKIKQIAANLLTNAAKYTDKGSVTFTVNGKWTDSESYMLHMIVDDTGTGIKPADFARLFDSFTRFDEAKHLTTEGTGLGLSITKQLVDLMHGSINVESNYGVGSRFEVKIPQRVVSRAPIGEFHASHEPAEQTRELFTAPDAKILVVDDNNMNLSVMKLLLKRLECETDLAQSGTQCLEMCREKRYDLILMDHMMPELDGIETLQKLRESDGANSTTQVIVLTANATAGIKSEYIKNGFSDYLSKPVDVGKLERMLLKYLPQSKIHQLTQGERKERKAAAAGSGLIDRNIGLKYCADDEEVYLDVVRSYHEQGQKYMRELPGLFSERNFPQLAIIVHAVKSTSMTIGAAALSELAKQMEGYAKAGDAIQLDVNREKFMSDYELVLKETARMVGADEKPPEQAQSVSRAEYLGLCSSLLEKIRGYENAEAEELLSRLENVTFDGIAENAAEELSAVAAALGDFDYDAAEKKLTELIGSL